MRVFRRVTEILTGSTLILTLCAPVITAESNKQASILFTHVLHSHFLPVSIKDVGESGGYTRLASLLENQRAIYMNSPLIFASAEFILPCFALFCQKSLFRNNEK